MSTGKLPSTATLHGAFYRKSDRAAEPEIITDWVNPGDGTHWQFPLFHEGSKIRWLVKDLAQGAGQFDGRGWMLELNVADPSPQVRVVLDIGKSDIAGPETDDLISFTSPEGWRVFDRRTLQEVAVPSTFPNVERYRGSEGDWMFYDPGVDTEIGEMWATNLVSGESRFIHKGHVSTFSVSGDVALIDTWLTFVLADLRSVNSVKIMDRQGGPHAHFIRDHLRVDGVGALIDITNLPKAIPEC